MFQLPTKPSKTVMSVDWEIELDKVYNVTIVKTINGKIEHDVIVHGQESDEVKALVKRTIINLCNKQGVFEPSKS